MSYHDPVLLDEALDLLITDPCGIYVDGTVGGGGHSAAMCRRLDDRARVVCLDADGDALKAAQGALASFPNMVTLIHANAGMMKSVLHEQGIQRVAGIFFDLGVSSFQIDEASKGFSYRASATLDMRMDRRQRLTARDVVNAYEEAVLERILREYGEEKFARRLARGIVAARPIETTLDLVEAVKSAASGRFLTKTLARVFQAIRIEVNNELENLRKVLADVPDMLVDGGRVVVIAYHSLEDRIVKDTFRSLSATIVPSGNKYVPDRQTQPLLRVLTRKPVEPSHTEVERNPRARSARLRAAERVSRPAGALS